jgi:hypothetical protein
MQPYKNKAKCGYNCTKRARYKAWHPSNQVVYACPEHKDKISHLPDPAEDSGRYTEADYQTWLKL